LRSRCFFWIALMKLIHALLFVGEEKVDVEIGDVANSIFS
jgi:hypothetical protein